MKIGILCLLLLSACGELDSEFDYALTWTCLSPEGCERADDVVLIDRLVLFRNVDVTFRSTRDPTFYEFAQRVPSSSLPEGCSLLYSLSLFGYELEPSLFCPAPKRFDVEFSIPNRNPATHSRWLVEMREL